MAGGKETLRQKMIGMMYLVLTALLALQVSTNILDKFAQIDKGLSSSAASKKTQNEKQVTTIASAVKKDGRKQAMEILDKANEVRSISKKFLDKIDALKEKCIDKAGGRDPITKEIVNAKDEMEHGALLFGPGESKSGEAYKVQKELNSFSAKMSTYLTHKTKQAFPPLAVDGKDQAGNKADWVFINFQASPVVASLCILTKIKNDVLDIEGKVLLELANMIGAGDISFDQIKAQVTPEQSVLAAGTKYKAKLFIAASSSGIKPKMTFSGQSIAIDKDGMGQVEFTASGGAYDQYGKVKKTWQGTITIPSPGGGDTTYSVTQEYIVVKPVIQIQSASVQALYLNCGNALSIQVPALGETYTPSFSVVGGAQIPGAKTGEITIVPNAAKVQLSVSSGGNLIGTEEFKVRGIPLPTIEVLCGAKPCNEKLGEASCPRQVTVKAISDESFKTFLPMDARYKVTDYEITLARGRRSVAGPLKMTADVADLSQFASMARSGDRILFEIKGVTRRNFRNENEKVNMGQILYKNIPIQ